MSCLYHSFGGVCQFYDKDEYGIVKDIHDTDYGFVGEGACVVDEDPDPYFSCSSYENIDPTEDDDESEYTLEALDAELDIK